MFRLIRFIFNTIILVVLGAILTYLIIDPSMIKEVLEEILLNFENSLYQIIAIAVLILYFVAFIFSYVERLFGKKKNKVSIKAKNSEIEVNFSTLESIVKRFLESKNIIKAVKVEIIPTINEPNIEIFVECYKTDNLNEKLDALKKELENHIEAMVGVKLRKITMKVTKIDEEMAEEKINEEVIEEIIEEVNEEVKDTTIGDNVE